MFAAHQERKISQIFMHLAGFLINFKCKLICIQVVIGQTGPKASFEYIRSVFYSLDAHTLCLAAQFRLSPPNFFPLASNKTSNSTCFISMKHQDGNCFPSFLHRHLSLASLHSVGSAGGFDSHVTPLQFQDHIQFRSMLRCSVIGVLNTHYFTGRFRVLLGISFHSAPIFLKQNYSHKVGIVDALLNDFYDFLSLSVLLASCSCWQNGHMERQMPTKWFENCRSIYNGCLVFQA